MLWNQEVSEPSSIGGERRSDRRYDIRLELQWKLIRRRRTLDSGSGLTVDFSSGGILFEADRQLPAGLNVELSIAWPVLLHYTAPMKLVATGRSVRTDGKFAAIQMTRHEFRTAGVSQAARKALGAAASVPGALLNMRGIPGLNKVQ
jgi:c-di-GMP-binding flagellar brake protein YcgR